jgi:hypothetical protein
MSKLARTDARAVLEQLGERRVENFKENAHYDAQIDETGISLRLFHDGNENTRNSVELHLGFVLFADMLRDLAKAVSSTPALAGTSRDALRQGAETLYETLARRRIEPTQMTPEEEVLLLHVLE